jgi:predicted lipoprotein with Yx(FWY)xxD motif
MIGTRVVQTSALASALLAMAACGSSSSSSSASAGSGTQISVASTSLGSVLTDDQGRVLYMFNPDNRGSSVCYDACAAVWPATLTTGAPTAGTGADASLLGTTKRTDGSSQVTYNKYPLYTFTFDQKAGDTNGQAVKSIWWVLNAAGVPQQAPAKVSVAPTSVGKVLTDVKGETLYMFAQDKNGKSSCDAECLKLWVPMHTFGAPTAGTGAQAGLLGTTTFAPGVTQVTYNKHPLYFNIQDQVPGDTKGQAFENQWYVVDGSGAPIKKAQ